MPVYFIVEWIMSQVCNYMRGIEAHRNSQEWQFPSDNPNISYRLQCQHLGYVEVPPLTLAEAPGRCGAYLRAPRQH